MKKSVLLFFLSSFSYGQIIYYVSTTGDNNNLGTQASPWRTIQFAIDQSVLGETILVESGVYQEIITFDGAEDSGDQLFPINLKANGEVLIDGSSFTPNGRNGLINVRNAFHIVIDGFEIANYKTPNPTFEDKNTPIGILIEGEASNIVLKNNKVHDIKNFSSCNESDGCETGANGIAVYGTTPIGIINIEIVNNEIYQCVTASSEALTINGNVSGFKILNNNIHDNNNIGFDFIGYESDVCASCTEDQNRARNGYVKGNIAKNNSIFGSPTASPPVPPNPWYSESIALNEGSAAGFYADGGRHIIFDGNISTGNDIGFEFAGENINSASEAIVMANNFIFNNKENGLLLGGFSAVKNDPDGGGGEAKRVFIYNNSFYKNRGWGSEIVFQNRVTNCQISNNIFYGAGTAGESYVNFNPPSNSNNAWGENIWFGSSTSDSNSLPGTVIAENPDYVDPNSGNLELQASSTAIDNGVIESPITNWTSPFWESLFPPNGDFLPQGNKDIKGNPRVYNTIIDFGAHEFGSILSTNDNSYQKPILHFYPNPASKSVSLSTKGNYHYSIFNITGKRLLKGATKQVINVSTLSNGLYFVHFLNNENRTRFVKKLQILK